MICNVIPPQEIPKPQRRPTSVGGYFYFPLPGPGQPTAILVGVRGPVQGRQFSVEKELFRIGATPENDLVIVGDDYVSGKHAYLRYEKGSLWLTDQHSRNGTFLNDNQVTDRALTLKPGDRIRVGNSTLEVVQAPGR
jgi:pSer/pThr/pTyr-binding forkhead associated (FHA) protein